MRKSQRNCALHINYHCNCAQTVNSQYLVNKKLYNKQLSMYVIANTITTP